MGYPLNWDLDARAKLLDIISSQDVEEGRFTYMQRDLLRISSYTDKDALVYRFRQFSSADAPLRDDELLSEYKVDTRTGRLNTVP